MSFIQLHHARKPNPDQIVDTLQGYTLEVCLSEESKATAYHLRYRAYLNAYPHLKNREQLLHDTYDDADNSRMHLVWYENHPVATVRGCIWSDAYQWQETESLAYFLADIDKKLGKTSVLESNRYAVDPDFQGRKSLFAQMLCFRLHGLNSALHQCNYIVTAVRANHAPFYRRFLGMEVLSQEPQYVPWVDAPVVLLSANRKQSLKTALQRGMPSFGEEEIKRYAVAARLNPQTLAA